MITIENAIYSWAIFWVVYWFSGVYLTWKAHTENLVIVTRLQTVIQVLCLNMLWTLLGTVVIFCLPIKIAFENRIITYVLDFNIIKFILCNFITEFWFYHIHVMCHSGTLYKKLHKQHHEFTNTTMYGLTGMYSSGYESVVCNLFSAGIGPVVLDMDNTYLYIWFMMVALNSTFSHSGYTYGWLFDGSHGEHHKSGKNFGTMTIADRIYGTYKSPKNKIGDIEDKLENENGKTFHL